MDQYQAAISPFTYQAFQTRQTVICKQSLLFFPWPKKVNVNKIDTFVFRNVSDLECEKYCQPKY